MRSDRLRSRQLGWLGGARRGLTLGEYRPPVPSPGHFCPNGRALLSHHHRLNRRRFTRALLVSRPAAATGAAPPWCLFRGTAPPWRAFRPFRRARSATVVRRGLYRTTVAHVPVPLRPAPPPRASFRCLVLFGEKPYLNHQTSRCLVVSGSPRRENHQTCDATEVPGPSATSHISHLMSLRHADAASGMVRHPPPV